MANNSNGGNKPGYVTATLDEHEEKLLSELTELLGIGRATVIKMLLRERGPAKIRETKALCGDDNPSLGENSEDTGCRGNSQEEKPEIPQKTEKEG